MTIEFKVLRIFITYTQIVCRKCVEATNFLLRLIYRHAFSILNQSQCISKVITNVKLGRKAEAKNLGYEYQPIFNIFWFSIKFALPLF